MDENGCSGSDTIIVVGTSVEDLASKSVRVYPVPANTNLFVEGDHLQEITSVRVINILGETVIDQPVSGLNRISINVEALPAGNYVILLKDRSDNMMQKQIVIH